MEGGFLTLNTKKRLHLILINLCVVNTQLYINLFNKTNFNKFLFYLLNLMP